MYAERAALTVAGLAALMLPAAALAQKYWCAGRALNAQETALVDDIIRALDKALPAAPAGWTRSDTGAAGGADCGDTARPMPLNVSYSRSYLHTSGDSGDGERSRIAEIERQIAALRAEEEETATQLRAATASRDRAAMQPLQHKVRELKQQQAAAWRELAAQKNVAHRKAQETKNAQWAAAQKQEDTAHISVRTNNVEFARLYPDSKRFAIPGVPLAIQDRRNDGLLVTQLFFGRAVPELGAKRSLPIAIDGALPITRIQNLVVRINAWSEATDQLLKGIDVAALNDIVKK